MSFIAQIPTFLTDAAWILIPFLLVLTLIVFVHEMGHFLVARWCGVKVEAFSIGFGKEIVHFHDKHGTRWRLAWIPLGGYVKFMDDENGASIPSRERIEAMTEEERAVSFHAKPLWQRSAVVAAGPIANFLLAIGIFAAMFMIVGQLTRVPRIDFVTAGGPAAKAGLRAGDVVKAINGQPVTSYNEMLRAERTNPGTPLKFDIERDGRQVAVTATPLMKELNVGSGDKVKAGDLGLEVIIQPRVGSVNQASPAGKVGLKEGDVIRTIDGAKIVRFKDLQDIVGKSVGKPLNVVFERDGRELSRVVTPEMREFKDRDGKLVKRGLLGVTAGRNPSDWSHRRFGPIEAISKGVSETKFVIVQTLGYVRDVFVGKQSTDQLGGPIRIAEFSGKAAKRGLPDLVHLSAVLSISIGIINLFPIPVLDGGHLMFYAIEAIRRRPLSEKAQEIGFKIGLALVLLLMVFVTRNDIMRYLY